MDTSSGGLIQPRQVESRASSDLFRLDLDCPRNPKVAAVEVGDSHSISRQHHAELDRLAVEDYRATHGDIKAPQRAIHEYRQFSIDRIDPVNHSDAVKRSCHAVWSLHDCFPVDELCSRNLTKQSPYQVGMRPLSRVACRKRCVLRLPLASMIYPARRQLVKLRPSAWSPLDQVQSDNSATITGAARAWRVSFGRIQRGDRDDVFSS